ncbi:MAG: hypothetical protein B7X07_03085 [Actinobacteria bacterium 21-64-8]|nr:MAG: hypothetical protein B7X07_03085 [Actinobacteria bacterium 21-64-8]
MATRAVQVVTEVAALNRPFDYAVTEQMAHVGLGDRVRVNFNHRSVRGWVVAEGSFERDLKPVAKWLGYGPPPALVSLTQWAAWRWYGSWSRLLATASPSRIVTALASAPQKAAATSVGGDVVRFFPPGVISLAPTVDPLGLVLGCYEATREREGSFVVLVPHDAWAKRLADRLTRRGLAVANGDDWVRARAQWPLVVATRAGAFSPVPRLAGALVLDADDEGFSSTAAPTWNALEVMRERCRREDVPLWCTSALPSPALSGDDAVNSEGGAPYWPRVSIVNRRYGDPHDGALSSEALDAARRALESDDEVAVVIILQRLGAGRLLACVRCGELATCAMCGQGEREVEGRLRCAEEHVSRERFCRDCGATKFRSVRSGITTLARDVALQLGRPVSELSAQSVPDDLERVVVGTEAVLTRVRRSALVIFADVDQYLLAPRASARRQAVLAVARAGRLVGSRQEGRGLVLLQTRRSNDLVLDSVERGDVEALRLDELDVARALSLAPYGARARVSGDAARTFVGEMNPSIRVRELEDGFVLSAPDTTVLANALSAAPRPAGSLRVAVE